MPIVPCPSLCEGGQQADTMPQAGPGLRHPLLQVSSLLRLSRTSIPLFVRLCRMFVYFSVSLYSQFLVWGQASDSPTDNKVLFPTILHLFRTKWLVQGCLGQNQGHIPYQGRLLLFYSLSQRALGLRLPRFDVVNNVHARYFQIL